MQMEAVKRAEEEIAEVGEEDYDFFKGEFPMSRSFFSYMRFRYYFFFSGIPLKGSGGTRRGFLKPKRRMST